MKLVVRVTVVVAALFAALASAHSRVPPVLFCWTPDVEFPIACEDEDDDDDAAISPPGSRSVQASQYDFPARNLRRQPAKGAR